MKARNGFTLLENKEDVKKWLNSQKVSREITRLQVHHMDLPNYSTWEKTDKKVFDEPHFGRTQSPSGSSKYTTGIYKVNTDTLNIRKGPSASYDKVGAVKKGDAYTIIKVNGNWGYLKSGLGWIHLGYCKKI